MASGDQLLLPTQANMDRERAALASCSDAELMAQIAKWPHHAPGIAAHSSLMRAGREFHFGGATLGLR